MARPTVPTTWPATLLDLIDTRPDLAGIGLSDMAAELARA